MTNKRSHSGGTTALVIVLTLVIVFVGVGFFTWMKIVGGGKELQHATDSGNLNVAKQVLKSPALDLNSISLPGGISASNEFGDLTDPTSSPPNQVDLLTYDRIVGKCLLVALNAATENSQTAKDNATTLLAAVEGAGGMGPQLAAKLSSASNTNTFFTNLATTNSTRMLQTDGQVQANSADSDTSFMARTKASNIFINSNQLPAGSSFIGNASNTISKNGKQYITGYENLVTGLAGFNLQAVPMRPGEQPHLVNLDDFQSNNNSPLGGGSTLVPPNAFKSGGIGVEANATGQNMTMRSAAIVGTLNQDFPISIPRGYIKIDNSGAVNYGGGQTGGGAAALTNALMAPNSDIELVTSPTQVFGPPGTVQAILDYVNQHKNDSPQPAVPASLLQAVDSPSGLTSTQAYGMAGQTMHQCNNLNTFDNAMASPPPTPDPACKNAYNSFLSYYNGQFPTSSTAGGSLMAVEAFKCYILQARAAVGSGGCGSANAPSACTGLKNYNINGPACLPCNFASAGTLRQLLTLPGPGTYSGAANVVNDLTVRMYQIKPTATSGEISGVLDSQLAFGQVSYIYMKPGASGTLSDGTLTLSTSPPGFPINASATPDGTAQVFDTAQVSLDGQIVNMWDCEGYPHPWDCPAVPAYGENKATWTPSSGFNNLLGVLQFMNCASGGGDWCCPC